MDLYTTGQINKLYDSTTSCGKELDLRKEFGRTLFGANDEISKGRIGLIRQINREDNGDLIRCSCRDKVTDEADGDFTCPSCFGVGYLWNEYKIVYYKNDDAHRRWGYSIFYLECTVEPTTKDFIVEVKRNIEGVPISPIVRQKIYKIDEAEDFRADNGRIEYWRCRCSWEENWSLWGGRYLDGVQVRSPGAGA